MIKSLRLALCCISLLVAFISCKKKEEQSTAPPHNTGLWCTLVHVVHQSGACRDSTVVTFDGEGRVNATTRYNNCAGGSPGPELATRKWFAYDGDKVYILDTSFMADKDTLIVDAALRIIEHHRSSPLLGTTGILGRYEYTTEGLLKASVVSYNTPGAPSDTMDYIFSNGDLTAATSLHDTVRYAYYTDKPVPANGYITQNGLSTGSAFLYKNAHLLKEMQDGRGNVLSSFRYEFDAYGNVTSKIATGNGNSDTTRYDYQCAIE